MHWLPCVAEVVMISGLLIAQSGRGQAEPPPTKMTDDQLRQVRDGFDLRVEKAFEADRGKPLVRAKKRPPLGPGRGNYVRAYSWSLVDFATRCFRFNEQLDRANEAIVENAQHYLDNPDDINDRDSFHWHADMLCRLIELYGSKGAIAPGRLSRKAEAMTMQILWRYATGCVHPDETAFTAGGPWMVFGSDNHHTMDFTTKWHFAKLAKDSPDYRERQYPDGSTAATQYARWNAYLKNYCTERAKKGLFVEFFSKNYNAEGIRGFYGIYDFTDDPLLRQRMGYLLDLHWAMWAQEQIDGVTGGGKARIYQSGGDRTGNSQLRELAWFYFGIGEPQPARSPKLPALLSSYRPPLVVIDLALDVAGRGHYEVVRRSLGLAQGKKHASSHQLGLNLLDPRGGSLVCYSWCTPAFILGTPMVEPRPWDDWVGMSAQNRWHGVIFAGPRDARIVPQVRANDDRSVLNAQWSVQRKGTLICQKLKTSKKGKQMRVWFSKAGLTSARQQGGWTFVEAPQAYAAVGIVSGKAEWEEQPDRAFFAPPEQVESSDGRKSGRPAGYWLHCSEQRTPVILEVASKRDFPSYDAFCTAVLNRPVSFKRSVLRYQGLSGDRLTFYADQTKNPEINGTAVDYSPPWVLNSPFIKAPWNSGIVTIAKDGRSRVLDFNADTTTPK